MKELGPEHPGIAVNLTYLGDARRALGDYEDAESLLRRAMGILEGASDQGGVALADTISILAKLYKELGRHDETLPLLERALGIVVAAEGPDAEHVATIANNLAVILAAEGRYEEAEKYHFQSVAILEKRYGGKHPNLARSLNNIAELRTKQGRYADAEPVFVRALGILENAFGPESHDVALTLDHLGSLYRLQGRYDKAEALLLRSIAIEENIQGANHRDIARGLNNLASIYVAQERYDEAEPLLARSVEIMEATFGEHPEVAQAINNLAEVNNTLGNTGDAETLFRRAAEMTRTTLGEDHPGLAIPLNNLAAMLVGRGEHDEAIELYRQALALFEGALGPSHPKVATVLNNLAGTLFLRKKFDEALAMARRASNILRLRFERVGDPRTSGLVDEQRAREADFLFHVRLLFHLGNQDGYDQEALRAEAFELAQLARTSTTARALARMGARFATGSDDLAELVRQRQDALERWRRIDSALVANLGLRDRDRAAEEEMRKELGAIGSRVAKLDAALATNFPQYAELASPQPLAMTDVQTLLSPDEAMISFLVGEDESYVWTLTHGRAEMVAVDIGQGELEKAVRQLRRPLQWSGRLRRFPVDEALRLYRTLIAPAQHMLTEARHVFVVPDGSLRSLPLGVLVTEDPVDGGGEYRDVPWLAKKYATTVLPSVSSLRALLVFAARTQAAKPFIGFGDPILDGGPGGPRGVEVADLMTRGQLADVEKVRNLASLPNTAEELLTVAASLGAQSGDVHLREAATETMVRETALTDYRVVTFATHALTAGDFAGQLAEPALVLTPPDQASERDDGLLTASEVAQLNLNADWVVLSACNTAAADGTPGAEGLSGLAKAFFYAGSRALLVSHWSVETVSAQRLTTGMFAALLDDPGLGRSEALRHAMLALMEDEQAPHFAHPLFWAPFTVVGEGGNYQGSL